MAEMDLWQYLRQLRTLIPRKPSDVMEIAGVKLSMRHIPKRLRPSSRFGFDVGDAILAADMLNPDDSVLIVGAGIAFLPLFVIRRSEVQNYCVVEPDRDLVELMKLNFTLNGLPRARFMNASLSRPDTALNQGMAHQGVSCRAVNSFDSGSVPAVSIDDILELLDFAPTALILSAGQQAHICENDYLKFKKVFFQGDTKEPGSEDTFSFLERHGFSAGPRMMNSRVYSRP